MDYRYDSKSWSVCWPCREYFKTKLCFQNHMFECHKISTDYVKKLRSFKSPDQRITSEYRISARLKDAAEPPKASNGTHSHRLSLDLFNGIVKEEGKDKVPLNGKVKIEEHSITKLPFDPGFIRVNCKFKVVKKATRQSNNGIRREKIGGKPAFKCSTCGKLFRLRFQLNCHLRKHLSTSPSSGLGKKSRIRPRDRKLLKRKQEAVNAPSISKTLQDYANGFSPATSIQDVNTRKKRMKASDGKIPRRKRAKNSEEASKECNIESTSPEPTKRKKRWKCEICQEVFSVEVQLQIHQRVHTGSKGFRCEICGKEYDRSSAFKVHMRSHLEAKPFKCLICGQSFSQQPALNAHKRVHVEDKSFVCNVCGKSFATKYSYVHHIGIHTGDSQFICKVCNKVLSTNASLKVHQRIHTGEKPFACDLCSASFRHNSALICHKRLHTGEKPFECTICRMAFALRHELKSHERVHA